MAEWREILNGAYEVSDEGQVRRLLACKGAVAGKILRPQRHSGGYLMVSLCVDGSPRGVCIHRLVALAFIGRCPDGQNVNHKNGNKKDNRLRNLEYVTYSGNTTHALRRGAIVRGEAGRFA